MITLPVEQDGDDYIVTFTDDLLEELGWSVGDDLNWDVQDDGTIIVTKHESERIHPPTEERAYKPHRSLNPLHDC